MKTYKFIKGEEDDYLNAGDCFLITTNDCYIRKIDKDMAIIRKLKSIPETYQVINNEKIDKQKIGYKCKCLTTNNIGNEY